MVSRKVHSLEVGRSIRPPATLQSNLFEKIMKNTNEKNPKLISNVLLEVKPKDFIAGFESGVAFEIRNESGDWEQYMSMPEKQYKEGVFDTMSCTNFDTLKIIQGQINFLLKNNKIPEDKRVLMTALGYFDGDGMVNFSEAFNAITSGTTAQGNYLQNPPEAVRKFGLLPQKDFITPENVSNFDEWIDPKRITPEMYAKAKRFNEIFDVSYEWICTGTPNDEALVRHAKQSPISIAIGLCGDWFSPEGKIALCDNKVAHHAVSLIAINNTLYKRISDQYVPFLKTLDPKYHIAWALKIIVTVKQPVKPSQPIKFQWTRGLKAGDRGYDVVMLQRVLMLEVPTVFNIKNPTDFFGARTFAGVVALQEKYASEILAPFKLKKGTGAIPMNGTTYKFLNKKYA